MSQLEKRITSLENAMDNRSPFFIETLCSAEDERLQLRMVREGALKGRQIFDYNDDDVSFLDEQEREAILSGNM